MKKFVITAAVAAFSIGLAACAESAEEAPAEEPMETEEATAEAPEPAAEEAEAMGEDMMDDDAGEVEAVINPDGDAGGPRPTEDM